MDRIPLEQRPLGADPEANHSGLTLYLSSISGWDPDKVLTATGYERVS